MNQLRIHDRLYRFTRFVFIFTTLWTAIFSSFWWMIAGCFVVSIIATPLGAEIPVRVKWVVMAVVIAFNTYVWVDAYSELPDRYPNEVMAFTNEFIELIRKGELEEARARTNKEVPGGISDISFAEDTPSLMGQLEFEALVYWTCNKKDPDKVCYEVYFLGEDTQVMLWVYHIKDDPNQIWVKSLHVRPMAKYHEPPSTFWMRGDRHLK